jgi:hypothetical protein
MILVDKESNNPKRDIKSDKSVFAIGDYRHNLPYKTDADYQMSKVSQQPKEFFTWVGDDNKSKSIKFK